jgi:hypothetical protein
MIDKFHLDRLSVDEWRTFCERLIGAYQEEMRRMISENEAPF